MQRTFFRLVLLLGFVALLTACTGYDEGPAINFTSAEKKLADTWRIAEATQNGQDVTARYAEDYMEFSEEGDFLYFESQYAISLPPFTQDTVVGLVGQGTWQFVEQKQALELLYSFRYPDFYNLNYSYDVTRNEYWEILRLFEDELWLKNDSVTLKLEFFTE